MTWAWIVLVSTTLQYAVSEVFSLFDVAARWLIRRSVTCLPDHARARYAQEWDAELRAIPGSGLWRLLFALRVRLGVRATASELAAISARVPLRSRIARVAFMFAGSVLTILLAPITILLAGAIAARHGRPILRSRIVRARDGSAVTLHAFNAPASSVIGRFLDSTDLEALPSLIPMARGRIWPTVAQLRIIACDVANGRPTQPFRD